jgi:hypothetical protein
MGTAFVRSGHSEQVIEQQAGPGILVFSRSLQLQYVNRRALELVRNIGHARTEADSIVLSTRLLELRDQIQESLDDRLRENIWEPFEVSRAVTDCGQRLLLRGFGCPDRAASPYSRIIIVLEEIKPGEKERTQRAHGWIQAPERLTGGAGLLANS